MEVIVAIGILAVIGVFSSTLLTRTYNSSAQSDSISKLKQNGQFATNVLTESIRMADGVICTGAQNVSDGRHNYIVIRDSLGRFTRFWFVEPIIVSGQVTANGYLVRQDNLDPDQYDTFSTCAIDPTPDLQTSTSISISDSNLSTGVSISGGDFKQKPGNEGKDTIEIEFKISPAGKDFVLATDVVMQTTVKVR